MLSFQKSSKSARDPDLAQALSPLDKLLTKAGQVRTYLTSPEGQAYREFLQEWLDQYARELLKDNEPAVDARIKGSIRTLEKLIDIPNICQEYLQGVSSGKFKKIVTEMPKTEEKKNV